jgi:hypothetical protein
MSAPHDRSLAGSVLLLVQHTPDHWSASNRRAVPLRSEKNPVSLCWQGLSLVPWILRLIAHKKIFSERHPGGAGAVGRCLRVVWDRDGRHSWAIVPLGLDKEGGPTDNHGLHPAAWRPAWFVSPFREDVFMRLHALQHVPLEGVGAIAAWAADRGIPLPSPICMPAKTPPPAGEYDLARGHGRSHGRVRRTGPPLAGR